MKVVRINDNVNMQVNEQETIILDLNTEEYYGLTGLYKIIVDTIKTKQVPYHEFVEKIIAKYDLDNNMDIYNELIKIISELELKKIIVLDNV